MIESMSKNQLNELSFLCKSRNDILNILTVYQKELNDYLNIVNKKIYCFGPVWCFTWRIIVLFLLFVTILYLESVINNTNTDTYPIYVCLFIFLIFAFIGMLGWSFYKVISDIKHHYKVNKAKKKIIIVEDKINETIKQIELLSKQISKFDYLPEAYLYAGDVIINYILNRRADCLKEAINLFEYERRMDIQFNRQMAMLEKINNEIRANRNSNFKGNAILTSAVLASGFISRI